MNRHRSLVLLSSRRSSRCRWPRTSPASTAAIPAPRIASSRRSPTSTARGRRSPAILPGFGAWFDDHFGFRSTLVRWYGESRLFGLGVSPSAAVVKGRDGWFFYADDGDRRLRVGRAADAAKRSRTGARRSSARTTGCARAASRTSSRSRPTSTSIYPRGDAGRRSRGSARHVANRPALTALSEPASPSTCGRRCSRRRRGERIYQRPTRTGTIAARWSRTSRSSTPCAPGAVDAAGHGRATISADRARSSRAWIWRA